MKQVLRPSRLKDGDTVAAFAPSFPLAFRYPEWWEFAVEAFERTLGLQLYVPPHVRAISGHVAASAEQVASEINDLFAQPSIKGLISVVGGWNSNRLLPHLDFDMIKDNPKIFMGYSDVTVLNIAIHALTDLVTFNGPQLLLDFSEIPDPHTYTVESLQRTLFTNVAPTVVSPPILWSGQEKDWLRHPTETPPRQMYPTKQWRTYRTGTVSGKSIVGHGGSLLSLCGTKYWPNLAETILFVEQHENETLAEFHRVLMRMRLMGILDMIKGLVISRPMLDYDGKLPDTLSLTSVLDDVCRDTQFPIILDVDFGHTHPKMTLPLGIQVTIAANFTHPTISIDESPVV